MNQLPLWLPLAASVLGALIGATLAFFYQHKMEIRKEKRTILQVLMIYRNVGASEPDWIKSLNAIDLIYHDHQDIVELYHRFVSLTHPDVYHTRQYYEVFVDMVYTMAQRTGYKKLTKSNIRQVYTPEALAQHYPHTFSVPAPSNGAVASSPPKTSEPKEQHPERD